MLLRAFLKNRDFKNISKFDIQNLKEYMRKETRDDKESP